MNTSSSRREFLARTTQAATIAGAGGFDFLKGLPAVSAQETRPPANLAAVQPDLEVLVRLIEETPRERLLEIVAGRIRAGTGYRELFAATMLAGVRGIRPRPVGFKFHAVLVMNSAHLASMAASDRDRWLPLLWSMDNFKHSQIRNREEGNWQMPALADNQLPDSAHASRQFREAMDRWDEDAADRAIASWSRVAGANEIYEAFWRYGARDFRDIGHKAIYVANSYRTLQTIGWRNAEPILRSLAFALLEHEGTNPAQRDDSRDLPYRDNLRRATRVRADWQRGRVSREATIDVLSTLRTATANEGSEAIARLLNDRIDPISLWDGLFLTAGELLMRQPGIAGLHCVTTINALHFAYQTSGNDETRRLMLLQAAAFLPMFRQTMLTRGRLRDDIRLDTLEATPLSAQGPAAIDEILAEISRDKLVAASKTLALLSTNAASCQPLMSGARRLIFARGNDSHDYKFSAAALEDYYHVSAEWRSRFLAASVFWLRGSGGQETELIRRARAALGNG